MMLLFLSFFGVMYSWFVKFSVYLSDLYCCEVFMVCICLFCVFRGLLAWNVLVDVVWVISGWFKYLLIKFILRFM